MDVLTSQYARLTDSEGTLWPDTAIIVPLRYKDIKLYSSCSVVSSLGKTIMVVVRHIVASEHFAIMAFDDDTGHSQLQTSV